MKTNKDLPLDQFIEFALYDKDDGYYMKRNPFGKEGDFITAPNITRVSVSYTHLTLPTIYSV